MTDYDLTEIAARNEYADDRLLKAALVLWQIQDAAYSAEHGPRELTWDWPEGWLAGEIQELRIVLDRAVRGIEVEHPMAKRRLWALQHEGAVQYARIGSRAREES